jgi:hypothetical protein
MAFINEMGPFWFSTAFNMKMMDFQPKYNCDGCCRAQGLNYLQRTQGIQSFENSNLISHLFWFAHWFCLFDDVLFDFVYLFQSIYTFLGMFLINTFQLFLKCLGMIQNMQSPFKYVSWHIMMFQDMFSILLDVF